MLALGLVGTAYGQSLTPWYQYSFTGAASCGGATVLNNTSYGIHLYAYQKSLPSLEECDEFAHAVVMFGFSLNYDTSKLRIDDVTEGGDLPANWLVSYGTGSFWSNCGEDARIWTIDQPYQTETWEFQTQWKHVATIWFTTLGTGTATMEFDNSISSGTYDFCTGTITEDSQGEECGQYIYKYSETPNCSNNN